MKIVIVRELQRMRRKSRRVVPGSLVARVNREVNHRIIAHYELDETRTGGSRHFAVGRDKRKKDSDPRLVSFGWPARARIAFRFPDFTTVSAQGKMVDRPVPRVIPSYFIIDEREDHSPRTTDRNLRPTAIKSSMKSCVRGHGWETGRPGRERETLSRCFIVFIYNWDSFCERDTPTTGSDSTARRRATDGGSQGRSGNGTEARKR